MFKVSKPTLARGAGLEDDLEDEEEDEEEEDDEDQRCWQPCWQPCWRPRSTCGGSGGWCVGSTANERNERRRSKEVVIVLYACSAVAISKFEYLDDRIFDEGRSQVSFF